MATRRQLRTYLGAAAAMAVALSALSSGASAAPGDTHVSLVRDINPGGSSGGPAHLEVAGGNLFFSAFHPSYGNELWMTTAAGTTKMVRNLQPDTPGSFPVSSHPSQITAVGSRVFFLARDAAQDEELYVSDGTAAGTRMVGQVNPFDDLTEMTAVGDTLYFVVDTFFGSRFELWKSDGTVAGTREVKRFAQVPSYDPSDLTEMGGLLYFTAFLDTGTGAAGRYLFRSDGTRPGTVPVKRTNLVPEELTAVGDKLYFRGLVAGNPSDQELWVTDGTAAGTKLARNLNTTPGQGSEPEQLTAVGSTLYFTSHGNTADRELYKSDGTPAGTRRVRDISLAHSSEPKNLTDVGGTLFFTAFDSSLIELYVSDGTFAGTQRVPTPPGATDPQELTALGDRLFYRARVNGTNDQLWVTDGTAAGTHAVGQESPVNDGSPGDLAAFNGALYLRDKGPFGHELYKVTVEQ